MAGPRGAAQVPGALIWMIREPDRMKGSLMKATIAVAALAGTLAAATAFAQLPAPGGASPSGPRTTGPSSFLGRMRASNSSTGAAQDDGPSTPRARPEGLPGHRRAAYPDSTRPDQARDHRAAKRPDRAILAHEGRRAVPGHGADLPRPGG